MANTPKYVPERGRTKDGTASKKGAVSPQGVVPQTTRRVKAHLSPVESRDVVAIADRPSPKPSHPASDTSGHESPRQAASPASAQSSRKTGGTPSSKTRGPQAAKLGASPEDTGFARTPSASPKPGASPKASGSSKPGASPKLVGSPAAIVSPQASGFSSPARSPLKCGIPPKAAPSRKSSAAPRPSVSPLPAKASGTSTPVSLRLVEEPNDGGATRSCSAPKLQRIEVAGGKGRSSGPSTPRSSRSPAKPILRGDAKAASPAEDFKASRQRTRSPSTQPRWPTPSGTEISSPLVSYRDPGRSKVAGSPALAPASRNLRCSLPRILFVASFTIVVVILVLIITVQIMKYRKARETALSVTSSTVSEGAERRIAEWDTTRHWPSSRM